MRNKKENFSNQNNNQTYKKLEKGEQTNKNTLARKKLESLNSPINNFFLYIFLVLAICLTTTLYLFYRFNSNNTDELYYLSDVHRLKAYIKPAQFIEDENKNVNNLELNSQVKLNINLDISGFIEINEVFDGISIIGKLSGFTAGSTHAVHIIEFSDIIATIEDSEKSNPNSKSATPSNYIKKRVYPVKDLAEVKLKHYNPLKYKHSCPSTNEEENYHFGDLGNIIANSEGKAFISIMRKISLKSLNGRLIVISNSPDKCKEGTEADRLADVIAYGQLNVFKPAVAEKANGSQEFFLREINVVNKEEFEKNNNLIKDDVKKDVKKDASNERKEKNIKNVNEDTKKDLKNNDPIGTRDSSNFKAKEGIGAPQSPPLINMRKDFEPANDNSLHSKDQNTNYFSNTVFNNDSEILRNNNNKVLNAKPDKNVNKNIVSNRYGPKVNKDLEIPMFNLNSNHKNNPNDFYRNDATVNQKKLNNEEDSTKAKNNNKISEDNDSFIKEFRELMKEANSQPKQIKSSDNMLFNPFSDSNAKLNNAKPAPAVKEFNPFETMNPIITEESEANKDKKANEFNKKNPFDLNKPSVDAYGSEIIFPKVDIINPPSKDKNGFIPENKNKKELSDEDILNDLLGVTDDLNKTIKKDPSSAKMKKAPSAAFIVPGSEGVIIENPDNNIANKNFYSNLKDSNKNAIRDDSNFFNVIEKETNDLKNSNNENLNIFGAPSGKKSDIGINKLFEDIVKEEEKAQQKKIENLNIKEANSNNKNLDLDLDSNLNQTSEKLNREIKKIPISLAQLETEKEENTKKMKKKKIDYNRSQISKDYSSLMPSNLEPLMNNFVNNSTAKGFINNVDLNLIDPYKISDMDDDNKNNNAKSPKEKLENPSKLKKETKKSNQELEEKKSIFSELSKEEEEEEEKKILEELSEEIKITAYNTKAQPNVKTLNKKTKNNFALNANKNKHLLNNPEDIYKIKIDNIENFQDIIKNKTLNDLERLPDKPIDLPLGNKKNNLEKSTSKNETTKADEKPFDHKSNNFLKEKNSLFFDMNKKENFRFLNKLSENNHFEWLKFRQNNLEKELKDNTTDLNVVAVLNKNSTKTASDSKENTELQQALENKIKNYYTQNKNYLQKINRNLTSLDKKILGIAEFEKDLAVKEKNNSAPSAVKVKEFDENKIKNFSDLNKDKNLITSFIQNVKANMGSNLKEIADKFLKEKPKKPIDLKGLSNSVISSIQNKVSKSEAENNKASVKKEKENKNEEEINKNTNIMIENGKIKVFQDSNINKKMKRPEKEMKYNIPSYFDPGLKDLDEDDNEEEDEKEEEKQKTKNISDDNENEFDNFFFIPKGSTIDTTHKGLFNIGNEISKDTNSMEDEIAEDIKLDLFDEPNFNTYADGKLNNNNKNKGKKFNKSGFKSMDKFLEKFGNDKIYTDKIHKVDKNKMFLNHFKNTLPKYEDN